MNKKIYPEVDVNHETGKTALGWVVKLEGKNHRISDDRKFSDWINASPIHIRELFSLSETWKALDSIQKLDKNTLADLLKADTDRKNVVPLYLGCVPSAPINRGKLYFRWPKYFKVVSMAACLFVISVISVLLLQYPRAADASIYSTRLGEQRSFILEDGSVLHLNTQSSISVIFSKQKRSVELMAGEAHFAVAHDKDRPFIVSTDNALIKAVGTAFNVYHPRNGDTIVTVVEGTVNVAASLPEQDPHQENSEEYENLKQVKTMPAKEYAMAVGGQVTIKSAGEIIAGEVSKNDLAVVTAWRQRRLVFKSHTLSEVAEEFNRYNRQEIIVDSKFAGRQEITGIFEADKPNSLIKFLENDRSLKVTKLYDKIFIGDR
ncbi:MAG: FecR domain-containing protein [Exilibacterium sp.]